MEYTAPFIFHIDSTISAVTWILAELLYPANKRDRALLLSSVFLPILYDRHIEAKCILTWIFLEQVLSLLLFLAKLFSANAHNASCNS